MLVLLGLHLVRRSGFCCLVFLVYVCFLCALRENEHVLKNRYIQIQRRGKHISYLRTYLEIELHDACRKHGKFVFRMRLKSIV